MKKILFWLSTAAFVIGISVFVTPSTSHATVINNVSVTVGNLTACITGCVNNIWSTAAGTNVTPGGAISSLVLTQTAGFNFDSSEGIGGANPSCGTPTACVTTLSINGVSITLSGPQTNALANFNADPGGIVHNEASDWGVNVFNGGPGGLRVWFAYADTAHTGTCADVDLNCLPENPWQGSPNTLFVGNTGGPTGCDRPGVTACFDAGAIRIEVNPAVPEPSAMLLMGIGLVGLAAWGKKRKQS